MIRLHTKATVWQSMEHSLLMDSAMDMTLLMTLIMDPQPEELAKSKVHALVLPKLIFVLEVTPYSSKKISLIVKILDLDVLVPVSSLFLI